MTQDDVMLLLVLSGSVALVWWLGAEFLLWLLRMSIRLGGDVWLWGACCVSTVMWMSHIS